MLEHRQEIIDKYQEINALSGTSIEIPKDPSYYQKNIKIVKKIETPDKYVFGGIIKPKKQNIITTDDIQLYTAALEKIDTYSVINKQLLMIHNMDQIPVEKIQFFYKLNSNLFQNDCNISIFNNLPKYLVDEAPEIIFNVCVSDTYDHKTQKKQIQTDIVQLLNLSQEMLIMKYQMMHDSILPGVVEYIEKQKNNQIMVYVEETQTKIAFFKKQSMKLLLYILDMLKQVY